MKVLFLTRYPKEGASSRYRVYQYLPELEKRGIHCDVSSFMDKKMYERTFREGGSVIKLLTSLVATIKRVAWLARISNYDVVYLQREYLPFGGAWMERWIAKRKPTVFDYDDALFIHKPSGFNKLATWLRRPEKYYDIFSCVDCVLAGNDWLAEVASEYNDNAQAFHVAEDTQRIPMRAPQQESSEVILGWLGSKTTEKYLELIREPLERLAEENPGIVLKIVGGGDFESNVIRVMHVPWSLDSEVDELCSFDIGLMPLPMEEWSKGKSGGKARTYMAAGVPPVVSKIGYNLELIENDSMGRLVETMEDWYDSLSELISNAALRQSVGEHARQHVIDHFSVTGQSAKLVNILQALVKE